MDINYILKSLIDGSIISVLLVTLIFLIRVIFKKRIQPRFLYYLWIIVFIKMLMPYGLESKFSIYQMADFRNEEIVDTNNKELSKENLIIDFNNFLNIKEEDEVTRVNFKNNSLRSSIFIFWFIGVLFLTICNLFSYKRIKKIIKISRENSQWEKDIEKIKKQLGINNKIRVIETDIVGSPSIMGILKPVIFLPCNLKEKLSKEEFKYIFFHELTHLKSKDLIIINIVEIIKTIYWFNPFIYIAIKMMKKDCELSCDYAVLGYLNNEENIKYGNTIIKVIENIKVKRQLSFATYIGKNKREVKGRIEMIIKNKKFGKKSMIIGISLTLALSAIALIVCSINRIEDKKILINNDGKVEDKTLEEPYSDFFNENEKIVLEEIRKYAKKNNRKIDVNSGASTIITLPESFDVIKGDSEVGKTMKILNEESKKEGYDFTDYLGEEVYIGIATVDEGENTIVAMVKDEKLIALFNDKKLSQQQFMEIFSTLSTTR